MDKTRLDKLFKAIGDLEVEVAEGIQRPLLKVADEQWELEIPSLRQDCQMAIDNLLKAEEEISNLRQRVIGTLKAADQILELHKQLEDQPISPTLKEAIDLVVGNYLSGGDDVLVVEVVQKFLVEMGVLLNVKKPTSVIASILARDDRLEWVMKGTFKRKVGNETLSEEK